MIVWLLKPAQLTALEMFYLNIVSTATNWSDQRCIAEHPRPFGHNIEQKWRRAVLMLELRWKVTTRENKMWKEGDSLPLLQVNLVTWPLLQVRERRVHIFCKPHVMYNERYL